MERVKAVTALGGLSSFCAIAEQQSVRCIVGVGVTLVPYCEVSNENPPTNVNTALSITTTSNNNNNNNNNKYRLERIIRIIDVQVTCIVIDSYNKTN